MAKQKNVLLIFTDQQRFDTIEAHGNPVIKTPVLNKLSQSGVHFDRAYTPCPVCVPARYAMLTGQLPHQTDCADNEPSLFRTSMMQILSQNGYQTFGIGKMHFTLTEPASEQQDALGSFMGKQTNLTEKWGFDRRLTSECDDADDYKAFVRNSGFSHVADATGERSEMYYIPQVAQVPPEKTETAWVTSQSISQLQNRDRQRPFFMMTSFQAPHPPFVAPFPWYKLYRGADMPLPKVPDEYGNLLTLWNKFQNRYKYMDQGINKNLLRTMKAFYYASISFLDYNIGQLLDYLLAEDLLEDTLIIFTSDHGELLGDYNSFGKRCFLDSAARVPLIIRYPGCRQNQCVGQPVSLVDIFPTILDYCGIEQPDDVCSGESLLSIAAGLTQRKQVYGQFQREGLASYMIVEDDYKYIYSAPDRKEWLFNHRTDPEETRNLAMNPLYIKKTSQLRQTLIDYYRQAGYLAPLDGDNWKTYPIRTMPEDPDAFLLFQDAGEVPDLEGYSTEANSKIYFANSWYE